MGQGYNIGDARDAAAVCLQAAAIIREHIRARKSGGGDEIGFCEDIVRQIQLFAQRFGFKPEADWLPEIIFKGDEASRFRRTEAKDSYPGLPGPRPRPPEVKR